MKDEEEKINKKENQKIIEEFITLDSIYSSLEESEILYSKPLKYERKLYEDTKKMNEFKEHIRSENTEVKDPYTGKKILYSQKEAQENFGNIKSSLEIDHDISIKELFEKYKKHPWIKPEDIKEVANSETNLQALSLETNRAKGAKTGEELINHLKEKQFITDNNVEEKVKKARRETEKKLDRNLKQKMAKNVVHTYNSAGIEGAKNAGGMTLTISGLLNIIDFINGKKSLEEAIWDVSSSASKAAALGYITSGTTTVISHTIDSTFTSSSSSFLQKLGNSNASAKVITTVIIIGDTVKRYISGEMTTKECLIELGEKGATFAALSPAMAVGQACIPVPVVGAAVGALVGSIVTSGICQSIKRVLCNSELQKQHEKLIAEYEEILRYQKKFRKDLDIILSNYLKDYENCFNDSLTQIGEGFRLGNINQMIEGANKITRKLNGEVKFENIDEFKEFFMDEKIDIF